MPTPPEPRGYTAGDWTGPRPPIPRELSAPRVTPATDPVPRVAVVRAWPFWAGLAVGVWAGRRWLR